MRSVWGRTLRYYLEDGLNEIGIGVVLLSGTAISLAVLALGLAVPEWTPLAVTGLGMAAVGPVVRRLKERRAEEVGGYVEWGSGGWRAVLLGLLLGGLLVLGEVVSSTNGDVVGLGAATMVATGLVAHWTGLRRYIVLSAVAALLTALILATEPASLGFAAFAGGMGAASLGVGIRTFRERQSGRSMRHA